MAMAACAVSDRCAAARHARGRARSPAREKNHRRSPPPEDSSSRKCWPARAAPPGPPRRTAWTTADRENRRGLPASARRRSETARQSLPTAAAASCTPARSAARTRKSRRAGSFPARAVKAPVENIIRHAFGKLRPRHDDESNRLDHVLPAVPAANFGEGVGADDEKNLAVHRFHPLDGMNRVAFFPAFFQTRRHEARVGGAGQLHHAIAILIAGGGFFQRRIRRRNKQNAVE